MLLVASTMTLPLLMYGPNIVYINSSISFATLLLVASTMTLPRPSGVPLLTPSICRRDRGAH